MTTIPDPNADALATPHDRRVGGVSGAARKKSSRKPRSPVSQPALDPTVAQLLARCAVNVTELAQQATLRPAYGRDETIETLWQLLRADSTRRPIILGKARSGKTAVAYELARRIAVGDCPPELRGLVVYETSPASLTASLHFGAGWREHLNTLIQGLGEVGNVLVFLRDAHAAFGAGTQGGDDESDLADALVGGLRGGKVRWLAEARADLWRSVISTGNSFAECFAAVHLAELTLEATRPILESVALDAVEVPPVEPEPEALETVLDIAGRFLLNQALPGKAIDLLEEALRFTRRQGDTVLRSPYVIACFTERTGLSQLLLDDAVPFDEGGVQRYFSERVLGQEPAISAVVQSIALLKARLNDPERPMGVFLFLGPTGVGKTELAKTLCTFLFGTEERLLRFNMADFAFYWQYEELFGDPDADEGAHKRGLLSRRLSGETFGVVLLDEFEKAHESIFQRFLQVFDEGILVNPIGEEINLRNMILIMTSNFGAQLLQGEPWGFAGREDLAAAERRILRETETFFTPEFINRLDSVIFFKPLSLADMRQIAYRELRKLFRREGLVRRGVAIELDDAVVDLLLKHGYSPRYGARYLKRQIEKRISYPLARAILKPPGGMGSSIVRLYTRNEHIEAGWVRDEDEEVSERGAVGVSGMPARLSTADLVAALPPLGERLAALVERSGLVKARERMDVLLAEMSGPAFWDDSRAAEGSLAELGEVSQRVDRCEGLVRALEELRALVARGVERYERGALAEATRVYHQLAHDLAFAELVSYFATAEEWGDAYVVVRTAPGDAQAAHWAEQLVDAYRKWATRRGLSCVVVDEAPLEGGEWRVTLAIEGGGAYGLLQGERGTHRFAELVQVGERRRKHVAQVRVEVVPMLEANALRLASSEVVVETEVLHGRGRLLRKLRSLARAVFLPSGTMTLVTSDGDAAAAEALARALLRGLLFVERSAGTLIEALPPWGSVARAYQLSRRSAVKDPRTGVVHGNPREVFEGDLDPFIAGYLQRRAAQGEGRG